MKHLIKIIVISLVISFLGIGAFSPAWAQKAPYKIGCNLELTGALANFLSFAKNGLILEQERVNAQGGIDGHPLELIFEDNAMDIPKAISIAMKFSRTKEIKAIIGPLWSVMTPTMYPVIEREKITQFNLCAPSAFERSMS